MLRKKDIQGEIENIESLRDLADVYSQLASIRMKKIRGNVLKNRQFLDVIGDIFKDTIQAYWQKVSLSKKVESKKSSKFTFLAHNGKTVAVFISANTGFYGDIVQRVFTKFIEDLKENRQFEITIIGRLGKNLFLETLPKTPFTYFDFPDFGIDKLKLAEITKHLVPYELIKIYYGRYKSVITQNPYVSDISAETKVDSRAGKTVSQFIFEPSVEEVLEFFETEIFASLFDQAIRESQLSKYASRIVSMDRANENIKNKLNILSLEKLKVTHIINAKKQTNNLGAIRDF